MTNTPLILKEIPKDEAIPFIRQYHYSRILPGLCKYFPGIFSKEKLSDVAELGWGTQPLQTICKLFSDSSLQTTNYLEIGKMRFLPEMNQTNYSGSQALSALIKWLKEHTDCHFLYILADGIEGKCGYVYRTSNFFYYGYLKTSVYRDKQSWEKIHPRNARLSLEENTCFKQIEKKHWLSQTFCEYRGIEKVNGRMFCYLYPLMKEAKKLLGYTLYRRHYYPKEKDLRFEKRIAHRKYGAISQPTFDKQARIYNAQLF